MINITKTIYKIIFMIGIIGMFLWVVCGWTYIHYKYTIAANRSVESYDGAGDFPVQISYSEYRQEVEEKLGNSVSYVEDVTSNETWRGRINQFVGGIEEKVESYTTATKINCKSVFIEAKKYVDKMVGLDMTTSLSAQTNDLTDSTDVVVETQEGQLGWVQDDVDISESLDNLIAFGLDMEEEGRNFIFFQNPHKYADSIPYIDYSEKYSKIVADAFEQYNLDLYDYEEALTALGMMESDIYYNTDHHWKPSTGILADKLMCEYLNDNYGYSLDTSIFEVDQYSTETYEGIFLGSLGKKVSRIYAEPDDFVIYYPMYDTSLTVYNSYDDSTKTGTVSETLFNYKVLEDYSLYDSTAYAVYGYGDQALIKVHNNLVNDGSHILVIKTSFADCMIPYLAATIEDLEVIDLRYYNGSLRSYIDDSNPDTVIVLTSISEMNTAEDGAFDFR